MISDRRARLDDILRQNADLPTQFRDAAEGYSRARNLLQKDQELLARSQDIINRHKQKSDDDWQDG